MKHIFILWNNVEETIQKDCMICPLAKKCKLKFPCSVTKSTRIFQLVHLDIWGSHKHPTYGIENSFLTVIDDHSRFTYISFLQSKKKVLVVLKIFICMVCD